MSVFSFFKRFRWPSRRKKTASSFETYSKFKHFFENFDHNDPMYPSVRQASSLCDDAIRIAKQRIRLGTRLQELNEKLNELEAFNNLTDAETMELKNMLEYFVSLNNERSMLLNQLMDYDPSLVEMFKLEEDALLAMPQIQDAEQNQRILRQDLKYLQGEKEELILERESMENTSMFVHRFTVAMVVLFVLATTALAFFYIFGDQDIFLPTTILILLVMFIVTLMYVFRRRLRYEMRLNFKKQLRAVELLNKKNVVFAYYTNFLRFAYKKYRVRNAQMLEKNLKDFNAYKFLVNRIDAVRNIMYEAERNIERFLREKHLTGVRSTIEGFARTINLEDKKRYYYEIEDSKNNVEQELSELDTRHEEIWDTLMVLNDRDHSPDKIIETIIKTYLDEASRLFSGEPIENDEMR